MTSKLRSLRKIEIDDFISPISILRTLRKNELDEHTPFISK